MNDTLAGTLNNIQNAELVGKDICVAKPISKLNKKVLNIFKDHHYIGEVKEIKDGKGGLFEINLIGQVNKCGVIKPRYSVKKDDIEKYEKRFLPAKDFGIIIISTNKGLMTHYELKEKDIGGVLISYVY